jgi:hypothetical protein
MGEGDIRVPVIARSDANWLSVGNIWNVSARSNTPRRQEL